MEKGATLLATRNGATRVAREPKVFEARVAGLMPGTPVAGQDREPILSGRRVPDGAGCYMSVLQEAVGAARPEYHSFLSRDGKTNVL